MADANQDPAALPGENLVRAVFPADIEVRDAEADDGGRPILNGHFALWNTFTEINSAYEGNFMERIAPGAFKKTLAENRANMRVLFQHGRDPQVGDKVLGIPTVLEEDDIGARYEVPLFATSYNDDLVEGLRAGAYGASFRFGVVKEDIVRDPPKSEQNPRGLPERTIQEARVMEFGPVTFPAYEGATAGVRSLTDDFLPGGRFAPGADANTDVERQTTEEPTTEVQEPTHSETSRDTQDADGGRANTTSEEHVMDDNSIQGMRARQEEIKRELEDIASENRGAVLSAADQAKWDQFDAEWDDLDKRCLAEENRALRLEAMLGGNGSNREAGSPPADTFVTRRAGRVQGPDDVFDTSAYHGLARSQEHMRELISEGAKRALETFDYPHPRADKARVNEHVTRILRDDSPDGEIAQRILNCGSPQYHRAFFKHMAGVPLTHEEQRALAVGAGATGQFAVPIDLDPTIIPTSNSSFNPIRAISRVVTTTSYVWNGVTSGGVTANYRAEGATMTDNSPTLAQPSITPQRADVFIPFSWEIGADWGALESALATDIQDAKDDVESLKFAVGTAGNNEPRGVLYGALSAGINVLGSSAATAFSVADVYAIEDALPARHVPNASWVSTNGMFQLIRQFDTAGGASFWTDLNDGNPPRLIGYPAYKSTNVGTAGKALTSTAKWGVFGDFSKYVIVDRIGMSIRMIDNLFSGNTAGAINYPRGQSGIVAYWRNSAAVVDAGAFRVGTIT